MSKGKGQDSVHMRKRNSQKYYRERQEIVEAILNSAIDGALKTNILYDAYLSSDQLKEYLPVMMKRGLLEYVENERKYFTTRLGKEFILELQHLKINQQSDNQSSLRIS